MAEQHVSKHLVNGELVEIPRNFKQAHLDAGYHEQTWGEHSHSEHDLLGEHDGILVEHLDEDVSEGCGGPVFRLTLPGGASVTALDADTVRAYLGA